MDIMRKKRMLLIGILSVIILISSFVYVYSYQRSLKYMEYPPPKIQADSIKSLVSMLIQRQEYFVGSVSVRFVDIAHSADLNKAEIVLRNDSTGGDSLGTTEYKMRAEKKGQMWVITQYKSHWKCQRDLPFSFWTTNPCS